MNQLSLENGFERSIKRTRRQVFLEEMLAVVPWDALVALVTPHAPAGHHGPPRTRSWCCCGSTSCSSGSRLSTSPSRKPCTTSRSTGRLPGSMWVRRASRTQPPSCASATSSSATTSPWPSSRRSTHCSGRVARWSARARWSMRRSPVPRVRQRTRRARVLHRAPDPEGEPVVLRHVGAHRGRRGLRPCPHGGGNAGQRARPRGGRFAAAR